jgi:hypothetical protein
MTPRPSDRRARTPAALRGIAVLALLTFGCTTVRAPASAIAPTVPVRSGVAEPQVELWLESAREVSPEESARAAAQARAALQQALADRQVTDGDTLLVVRAQGVSRTSSRRSEQRAAVAGIVVGAVALVAVVVVALVASKGSSGGKAPKLRGGGGGAGARPTAVPVVPVVRPRASPAPIAPLPPVRFASRPRSGAPEIRVGGDVAVELARIPELPSGGPPPGWDDSVGSPGASEDALDTEPRALDREEIAAVTLPPPRPLDVERRAFFEKDHLRLELVVVDARSGAALWVKTVDEAADVRDASAVRKVLDRALGEPSGWTPAPVRPAY